MAKIEGKSKEVMEKTEMVAIVGYIVRDWKEKAEKGL